jgi:molybdenum cofactor synthesis domain-containing protein
LKSGQALGSEQDEHFLLKRNLSSREKDAQRSGENLQLEVELIVVGNELLNGTTVDSNSQWLSEKLTARGFLVRKKTTVRDELAEISKAFEDAVKRKPDWILSVGGLGPTYDDKTLEGLAVALGRKVIIHQKALQMRRER